MFTKNSKQWADNTRGGNKLGKGNRTGTQVTPLKATHAPGIQTGVKATARGLSRAGLIVFNRGANQVIKGSQGRLCAFSHGNNDLLVRHSGHITCGEYAGHGGLAFLVDHHFAARSKFHTAFHPIGVRHQADLNKDTFQLDAMILLGFTIFVVQADDLFAIALHFSGECRQDYGNITVAVQFLWQDRIRTLLIVELNQGHMRYDASQIDCRFHARVTTTDHRYPLAFE